MYTDCLRENCTQVLPTLLYHKLDAVTPPTPLHYGCVNSVTLLTTKEASEFCSNLWTSNREKQVPGGTTMRPRLAV